MLQIFIFKTIYFWCWPCLVNSKLEVDCGVNKKTRNKLRLKEQNFQSWDICYQEPNSCSEKEKHFHSFSTARSKKFGWDFVIDGNLMGEEKLFASEPFFIISLPTSFTCFINFLFLYDCNWGFCFPRKVSVRKVSRCSKSNKTF